MNNHTHAQTILLISANPIGTSQLRLDEEIREIKEGLKRSKHREKYLIQTAEAVRYRDIHRAILDYEPNIVHFCGHGAAEQGLVFEDEIGQAKVVDTEAIAGLFELFADQVQCVILNACYSKVQAVAIAQHINYVIGMSQAIGDRAAIEFVIGFYDGLGAGKSVEFAYKIGCASIKTAGISENLTPKLLIKNQTYTQSPTVSSESEQKINASINPESPADKLKSQQGIDYTWLRDLLANGQWKQADQETVSLMLKACHREEQGWLELKDINNFPCEDLRIINSMWLKFSNGRFGFSVQKRIWQEVNLDYIKFGERVSWRKFDWIFYFNINYSIDAPLGHLPCRYCYILSRVGMYNYTKQISLSQELGQVGKFAKNDPGVASLLARQDL